MILHTVFFSFKFFYATMSLLERAISGGMKMSFACNKNKRRAQLKWSMITTLVFGWVAPLLVITFVLLYLISVKMSGQIEKTVTMTSDKAIELCDIQLNEAISSSRNASYMNNIRECYYSYKRTGKRKFLSGVTTFLNQQYKFNELSLCTMVFFLEDPETIYFTSNGNDDENNGLNNVSKFKESALEGILEKSKEINTDIALYSIDGRLYLYRNLMQTMYLPYGVIVMELNTSELFDNLNSVWGAKNYAVYMDGETITDTGVSVPIENVSFPEFPSVSTYVHNKDGAYVYRTVQLGGHILNYFVELNSEILIDELYGMKYIFYAILIFLIPLITMIFIFFHNKVTKPINELVKSAKEIKEGNYGKQIVEKSDSAEFEYLQDAFNTMSKELKRQFEKIYLEELALKDANIMALQSQINPHFLNNTLEIINWEARIQGNQKVSGMIEALSTMMNATMNRENRHLIPLKEELEYAKAYFYIISQRLGNRFQYVIHCDEELYMIEVPRLIIQPIVENAVEHGMYPSKQGMIHLDIWREEDVLYIQVKNNSPLSEEDKEKIKEYLYEDDEISVHWSGSVGIRNVNRRLKIIYGQDYGLKIESGNENDTICIMTINIIADKK